MTILAYAALWATLVVAASIFDNLVWLRHVRPALAKSYGWPAVCTDERIPPVAAAVGGGAAFILLFVLPMVGVSAGY